MHGSTSHGNREIPQSSAAVGLQTASGTQEGHADDERPWEVGQTHSTEEAAEQRLMVAEAVEGRGLAKGNRLEQNASRTLVPVKRAK
jgi:hypothetical protein